jgi:hypothetical protein
LAAGRQKLAAATRSAMGMVLVDRLCKGDFAPWPVFSSLPPLFQLLEDMYFIISSILFGIYLFLL